MNLIKGTVSEIFPKMCKVILDETSETLLCPYRRARVFKREIERDVVDVRERAPVAPGDFVQVQRTGTKDGVVEELLPRKNALQRNAPGKDESMVHTIAANVDVLGIVMSVKEPDFNLGLIDRFLVAAIAEKIEPIIFLTKIDLIQENFSLEHGPWAIYPKVGVRVFPVSIVTGEGLFEAQTAIAERVTVFCGHSGVGKTALLNSFFGSAVGKTGKLSESTGKGMHTTSGAKLIAMPNSKTKWIDTPGVREFSLYNIDPEQLIQCFPELEGKTIEEMKTQTRYDSFLRIKATLVE